MWKSVVFSEIQQFSHENWWFSLVFMKTGRCQWKPNEILKKQFILHRRLTLSWSFIECRGKANQECGGFHCGFHYSFHGGFIAVFILVCHMISWKLPGFMKSTWFHVKLGFHFDFQFRFHWKLVFKWNPAVFRENRTKDHLPGNSIPFVYIFVQRITKCSMFL